MNSKVPMDSQLEAILQRFDRSSPDRLLKSIAAEMARLHGEIAELRQAMTAPPISPPPSDTTEPAGALIDANERFFGAQGFYKLERDKQNVAYRWTGPNADFSFTFTINRSKPAKFALYFDRLFSEAPVDKLSAFVDGFPIDLRVAPAPSRGYLATGEAPARETRGDTVLTFVCPAVSSPRESGFDDDRPLGVSFRLLEVGSAVQEIGQPGAKDEAGSAPSVGEAVASS